MKSSGTTRVMPGTIATRSTPASTSTGQIASRNTAAKIAVPTETSGATRLAAKARPKCPMNTSDPLPNPLPREREQTLDAFSRNAASLEAVLDAGGRDRGARAARGMALHVHRHRVHGDVRGGDLDVHREGGGVAAEPLRTHAEHVDRLREARLDGCP